MKKLGELLVEREWLTRDQLTQALRHQQVFGGRLGSCLLELTLLSEDRLTKALSEQLGVPAVTADDLRVIADGLIALLPPKLACRSRAVPFERFGNALSVALVDTRDLQVQDELAFVTSRRLKVHVAPEVRILEALEKHYSCQVEPRFARVWDRLNRAKYLWQEEPTAPPARRRADTPPAPASAPASAPEQAFHATEWEPAPPPPLESGIRRLSAASAAHLRKESGSPPPVVVPEAPPSPLIPPEPVAPLAEPTPPTKRRWLFGSRKGVASPEVAPTAEVPERPPAPFELPTSSPLLTPSPSVAAPPPVVAPPPTAVAPAPPAAAARRERARQAPQPPAPTAAPRPAATPSSDSDVETLPPAPIPTPLVERGDTSPVVVAKTVATVADFESRVAEVEERDDVADAALSFFSRRFQRSLLFMVRGGAVAAWMGGGEGVDQRLFGEIEIDFDHPSLFLNLREGSPFYRGPLPRVEAHQQLVRAWGGRYPKECLLLPVRIKDRLVAVVYCDRGNEDLSGTDLDELQQVAALMGRGFETFLLKRKRA